MAKYYASEVTRLIRALLDEQPQIVEDQKKGRALWWDKKANADSQRRAKESNVRQQPYVYQTKV